jgi:hypothetical protein
LSPRGIADLLVTIGGNAHASHGSTVVRCRRGEATVTLAGERAVHVDELTSFGVQPITLTIASMPRPNLSIPAVTMPSTQLQTSVDVPASGMLRADISSLTIDDPETVRAATTGPKAVSDGAAGNLTRIGMQKVKDVLLDDLDEFLHEPRADDPARFRVWLTSSVAKFDGWHARIVTAPR